MRNHVLVVPTVICAAVVCERIAEVAPVADRRRCRTWPAAASSGPTCALTHQTLAAYCEHPNVGAVLVVALGCEQVIAQTSTETARRAGKPVEIDCDSGRRRHAADDRARPADRRRVRRARSRTRSREWCDGDVAGSVAQVRRLGLHVRARVESGARAAWPIGWSISAARRCSARSPRSWAPSTCSPRARRSRKSAASSCA